MLKVDDVLLLLAWLELVLFTVETDDADTVDCEVTADGNVLSIIKTI